MRYCLCLIALILLGADGFCQTQTFRLKHFNVHNSLALEGYDPVSYFRKGPKEGSASLSLNHQGVVYRFATRENLEAFKANPSAYEPQFGGWCAYAMGNTGDKVEVDPETYTIIDGKLYLFYNKLFNNTLKTWKKNETELKRKAEEHWKKYH